MPQLKIPKDRNTIMQCFLFKEPVYCEEGEGGGGAV